MRKNRMTLRSELYPDIKNSKGLWTYSTKVGGKVYTTESGMKWSNIVCRCNPLGAEWKRNPSYVGTKNLFTDFQSFAEWHTKQVGYAKGYHLDSDMFAEGEKRYSPETSVLIPTELNTFLITSTKSEGGYPRGMYYDSTRDKLLVQMRHPAGYRIHIGRFNISQMDKAMELYAEQKTEAGQWWYQELLTGKYEVENRVIEHMKNWKFIHK